MRTYLLLPFLMLITVHAGGAEKIPGQKPLLLIGDKFQFIPGSWSRW